MIRIRGLGQIGHGRLGLGIGMRVVKAEDLEPAVSRVPSCVDVTFRREEKSIRIVRNILDANRFDDFRTRAEQDAAALCRKRLACVCGHFVEHRSLDADDYNASTVIAMPIPPPIQSDATP